MAYLALPSFFPQSERDASTGGCAPTGMTLGLDLQGGVHWLLRVDTDAAIQRELEKLQSDHRRRRERGEGHARRASRSRATTLIVKGGDLGALRKLVDDNVQIANVDGERRRARADAPGALGEGRRSTAAPRPRSRCCASASTRLGVREPVIAPQGARPHPRADAGRAGPRGGARACSSRRPSCEFKQVLDAAPSKELLEAKLGKVIPEDQEIVLTPAATARRARRCSCPRRRS